MSYYDKAKDIYNMLATGKLFEAFDKYYTMMLKWLKQTVILVRAKKTTASFRKSLWV